jgi:hypothetical protein
MICYDVAGAVELQTEQTVSCNYITSHCVLSLGQMLIDCSAAQMEAK